MRALDVAGERAAALKHARVYEQLVREELDAAPEPAVTALVERLRQTEPTRPTNGVHTGLVPAGPAVAQAATGARVEPAMPDAAVGGALVAGRALIRAVTLYVAAFTAIALFGQAAVVGLGLPDWVFLGALTIAASGLPVILVTAFVQRPPNAVRGTADTSGQLPPAVGGAARAPALAPFAARVRRQLAWRRGARGGVLAVGAFAIFASGFMIGAALERIQRPTTAPLVPVVARELAQREGIKSVVEGERTPLRHTAVS